ncbi:MAG: MBL fold metallo-hydrolase, partial [Candidatus Goldbacteria bacterium]|nr:MBL fold metallo-hydrolase [Candidatus Goldiibacteriota bacterium]
MEFIFYGGANEIGGNKIFVSVSKTRIFLDFGEPFDRGAGIYSGLDFVATRDKLGLRDYFEFDLLPKLSGIYSKDALKYTDLKYKKPKYDAVCISHIHSDHFADVPYIDYKIPIFLGYGANKLNNLFNEIYSGYKTDISANKIVEVKTGGQYKIKDAQVIPIHMDHSIPGAYGYIIKTDEGNIAYTGDFRFHGFKPEMTEDFMKEAKKHKIKVLITEGTRVKKEEEKLFTEQINESDVEQRFYDTIKKTDGVTFVQFSFRNIDRVRSLCNAAKRAGKILVASPGFLYTIENARELVNGLPKIKGNSDIKAFIKDVDVPAEEKRTREYAKEYLKKGVDYRWVKRNLKDVVMFLSMSELTQMIDIQPKNGTFIFSMSEHYLEGEGNEEYRECLTKWINHFGLSFVQI